MIEFCKFILFVIEGDFLFVMLCMEIIIIECGLLFWFEWKMYSCNYGILFCVLLFLLIWFEIIKCV